MEFAINLTAILPVRKSAAEASEMVTQLLFGEYCETFESENSFIRIKNGIDGYEGWVDKKMLTTISSEKYALLYKNSIFMTCTPISEVLCLRDKSIYRLSAGSLLPNYNPETNRFGIDDITFQIHPGFVTSIPQSPNKDGILTFAMQFLNIPYLWGGKNIFGIDCSGLVQTVFSLCGIKLLRDASQQAKAGENIPFVNAKPGDLFFFGKTHDKVTHVGIYIGNKQIIHASGRVRIDNVDEEGIYRGTNKEYTHHLLLIRRTP